MFKPPKLSFSPFFIVFSAFILLYGDGLNLVVYLVSVIGHEYAHHFVASRFGVVMEEIRIYPFGAVLSGGLDRLTPFQEAVVSLAGPLFNVAFGFATVALWWIYPPLYVVTDVAVYANFAVAVFNLLPAYPLDGGRAVYCLLRKKCDPKKVRRALFILAVILSAVFFGVFAYSVVSGIICGYFNPQLPFGMAGVTLLYSALFALPSGSFTRAFTGIPDKKRLMRGVKVERLAVSEDMPLYRLFTMLTGDCLYEITVVGSDGELKACLDGGALLRIAEKEDMKSALKECIKPKNNLIGR